MKFTDGNWLMQPGVRGFYATEVYESDVKDQTLEMYVPTHFIRHRGDTLQGPVLTVRLSSPMADVIKVRYSHYEGGLDQGPHFEIEQHAVQPVFEDGEMLTLTSGELSAVINPKQWSIEFKAKGKTITSSPWRGAAYMTTDQGAFVQEQLNLAVGEYVYGLGERFTSFTKNGQTVQIWNRDGGTGSDQAYKNIPFYITNKGYGVFVNHPEAVEFEVGTEKVSRVQFSVKGEALEYFIIYGDTPKEILQKYTALTGRPVLPPAWTFGLWLTTSFTTNYDEATVTSFLDGMQEHNLPLSVFHFDCFWMKGFRWTDFTWDQAVFPDPEGMLKRFHERGLKVCVWINSYIAQRSSLFAEGKAKGYLLKRKDGSVWQWDLWQPGMAIVDFTNPDACTWYASHLKRLAHMGVDSFKTDFGERIPTEDVAWFDGSDPQKMHNYYTQLYNQVVFDALREVKGDAPLFARSATAGGQKFPVHWGGDCDSTYESMAESLRGGLSLGLSGFGFWSHDIGGFEGMPPALLYKRWLAFGLMSSHSRLHGSTSYRVPWLFDQESVDVLRYFAHLKHSLMPYLFQQAINTTQTGLPMMRAMLLEFPQDISSHTLDRQYMLGENLLVAPVFNPDNLAEFYLPKGSWTHLMSGEVLEGPCWVQREIGVMDMPIWVRPETVLVTGSTTERPDYAFEKEPIITLYQPQAGKTYTVEVPTLEGTPAYTLTLEVSEGHIALSSTAPVGACRVVVPGKLDVNLAAFEGVVKF